VRAVLAEAAAMSCGRDHFEPISSKVNPGWPDPSPAWQQYFDDVERSLRPRHPNWGGPRKNAGAKEGNLNALKHGRYSPKFADVVRTIQSLPDVAEVLSRVGERKETRRTKQETEAPRIMAAFLRHLATRFLDLAACPDHRANCHRRNHQVGDHQDILGALDRLETVFRQEAGENKKNSTKSS
jgi:hypothetical protein